MSMEWCVVVWVWSGVWWCGYGYMDVEWCVVVWVWVWVVWVWVYGCGVVPTSLWLEPILDHNFLMLDHSTVGTYSRHIHDYNYRS